MKPISRGSPRVQVALTLGALGVVFGDIGTSPLYTVKECIAHLPAGAGGEAAILGVLSLLFWSLVVIVCVKYLGFVTQADNHGEGGIFALLAQLPGRPARRPGVGPLALLILAGAALLYGDGVITPAISVLGAAEGLVAVSPRLAPWVVPVACVILAVLFRIQHKGTMHIGRVFGPVMALWFFAIGVLGAVQVAHAPRVLRAVDPRFALALLHHRPMVVAALLGAVVLVFTGAEALYADMGHFGRGPMAFAWYGAAFPGLVLNYFGQGAYLLVHPAATDNPFYAIAPPGLPRVLLTALAFAAAIIASQALISGSYSLTRQAIQLGYLPRLKVQHTHADFAGQIYIPLVNTLLAVGSILTVIGFGSTAAIAAAYGIAVTGTMAITTVAYYHVLRGRFRWTRGRAGAVCGSFLVVDVIFFAANAQKVGQGGWFPLAIALAVLALMHTWKVGRTEIYRRVYGDSVTEEELTRIARSPRVARVSGAGVFMAGAPHGTPIALLHHVKANRALHETVVLLSVLTEEVPVIAESARLSLTHLGEGVWRAVGRYGYMESPDAGRLMEMVRGAGVAIVPTAATYVFNREMILNGGTARMWEWQKTLYAFLSRNARPAKDYFRIPPSQIIEIGLPLQL